MQPGVAGPPLLRLAVGLPEHERPALCCPLLGQITSRRSFSLLTSSLVDDNYSANYHLMLLEAVD